MKRFILVLMIALAGTAAWAQVDLSTFQSGFTTFSADMASTLSYNATVGNNWSDAYIGGFPRFGVGLAIGTTLVPIDSVESLFASMDDIAVPDAIGQLGLPIPAVGLSAKLGGLFLPFDIGLKAMVLPESVASVLSASGITADYSLIGGNLRFALLKEKLLFPDISVGAGYNRLSGSVGVELPVANPTFDYNLIEITTTDPSLTLDWTTNSFDFTLQISKSLLFLRPYAGVGYSMGKSTVSGGLVTEVLYDGHTITSGEIADINAALAAAGQATAEISADGILFSAENSDPVLRVYGGVSLEILVIKLDAMVTYVPDSKSLGASAMIRFQL
jgi:hypothetical protein